MRATERDRRKAAQRLRTAYVDGALSTSTFELRVGRAVAARHRAELADLVRDLRTGLLAPWFAWLAASGRQAVPAPASTLDVSLPPYEGQSVLIGRDPGADAVTDDLTVSRRHALITAHEGCWRVLDLDSRNGVYLNGRRVRSATVTAGDVLDLGDSAVRLDPPRFVD